MKDFRYHLVSLTAVFLALAVGVVLGSGPLHNTFVGRTQQQLDTLETELEAAEAAVARGDDAASTGRQFADEIAPRVLTQTLLGQQVAIIQTAGASDEDVTGVRDRIVQAGATVTSELTVDESWTHPDQVAFRSSLATTMAPNVVGLDDDAPVDDVLAHALAQMLLPTVVPEGVNPASVEDEVIDPAGAAARAALLLQLLTESELLAGTVSGEVTAVVIVAGAGADDDQRRAQESSVLAVVAAAAADYAAGVVVASGPDADGDVPSAIANSAEASGVVSTVVDGTGVFGQISTALALSRTLDGSIGHYGPGPDRTLVPGLD